MGLIIFFCRVVVRIKVEKFCEFFSIMFGIWCYLINNIGLLVIGDCLSNKFGFLVRKGIVGK